MDADSDKGIRVYARCRPRLPHEPDEEPLLSVDTESNEITVRSTKGKDASRLFKFNRVFRPETNQDEFFEACRVGNMVDTVLEGFNASVLAYGQTSAGKTYCMEGFEYVTQGGSINVNLETASARLGIIPRAIEDLFEKISARRDSHVDYKIRCSYVQLYCERVYDLLNPGTLPTRNTAVDGMKGLRVRWARRGGSGGSFYVENMFMCDCENTEEAIATFHRGIRSKREFMASHKLNMASSRSHSLFTVHVTGISKAKNEELFRSKLTLVDLAGSERLSQTQSTGTTFKEGVDINKSLFSLRQVITALATRPRGPAGAGAANTNAGGRRASVTGSSEAKAPATKHVPYRDSRLTLLLMDSFGGNSQTLMIVCVTPLNEHVDENVSTLEYGGLAKRVINSPTINEDPRNKLIRSLRAENSALKRELEAVRLASAVTCETTSAVTCDATGSGLGGGAPVVAQLDSNKPMQIVSSDASSSAASDLTRAAAEAAAKLTTAMGPGLGVDELGEKLVESVQLVKQLLGCCADLRTRVTGFEGERDVLASGNADLMEENIRLRDRVAALEFAILHAEGCHEATTATTAAAGPKLPPEPAVAIHNKGLARATPQSSSHPTHPSQHAGLSPRAVRASSPGAPLLSPAAPPLSPLESAAAALLPFTTSGPPTAKVSSTGTTSACGVMEAPSSSAPSQQFRRTAPVYAADTSPILKNLHSTSNSPAPVDSPVGIVMSSITHPPAFGAGADAVVMPQKGRRAANRRVHQAPWDSSMSHYSTAQSPNARLDSSPSSVMQSRVANNLTLNLSKPGRRR
eukprot:Rmarinus@m.5680